MANEIFKLSFITTDEGTLTIDEPTGFDSADFTLQQEDKRQGRDISFAGGETEFTFYPYRNHYFEKLVYYYETFGWESQVQLIIETANGDNIIGDLDFYEAKTDLLTYFSCKVVQVQKEALIKKRNDIKVDLFSDKDLDDNDILPLETEGVLVLAKAIKQVSRWETPSPFIQEFKAEQGAATIYYNFTPAISLKKADIDETRVPFPNYTYLIYGDSNDFFEFNFEHIVAKNNLTNLKIEISNLDFTLSPTEFGDFDGSRYIFNLQIRTGTDLENPTSRIIVFEGDNNSAPIGSTYTNTNTYTHVIESLPRGHKLGIYFLYGMQILGADSFANIKLNTVINSMDIDISVEAKSYNTVVPSLRLYDAISQNVKSISQLPTTFPFAQQNGEMWNQRVLNGNMLRGITTKTLDDGTVITLPFYLSFKDIEEWLPEIFGDYEISDSGVYFGLYADFYRNHESGVFETVKFDDYEKSFNPRYAINHFKYGYSKYQSQKENDVENTYDIIHGESEWHVNNGKVENKKEIKIAFVRDAFLIAETQKKGLAESETTATQDDDTIFILDTREREDNEGYFEETDFLQHSFADGKLTLTNLGEFSWILLGLRAGSGFNIIGGDPNAGAYIVAESTNRKLILTPLSSGTPNNNGERSTAFRYWVSLEAAPYQTTGNIGFNISDNINDPETFTNLKYSIKRNIIRFYSQYLATCNLWSNKLIKNTFLKNNKAAILSYQGLTTIEDESFLPELPILDTFKHKVTVITDFATYKALEDDIRTNRGFIRVVDRNEFVLRVFPQELKFVNNGNEGELMIIGESKYENSLINIAYGGLPYLLINDYHITTKIIFEEKNEKFSIFDEFKMRLFKPAFWHKITVNGKNAETKQELIEWLTLIS